MADMPARYVPRIGFKPVRVEIHEQHTQKKVRPYLRSPRRSIIPGAFANHPTSPDDDSPPKRHEMNPARRLFSPMAIDTPAPVHSPTTVETPALVDTASVNVDMPASVETVPENDVSTPKSGEVPHESENITSLSPDAVTEKSAVSAVSSSSGSHSATSDSQNQLTDHASRMTASRMFSLADTVNSASAVSSSSVYTASTSPSGS